MKTYSARKFSNHVKKLLPDVANPTDYQIVEALYKLYGEKSAIGTYQRYDRLAKTGKLIPQPF